MPETPSEVVEAFRRFVEGDEYLEFADPTVDVRFTSHDGSEITARLIPVNHGAENSQLPISRAIVEGEHGTIALRIRATEANDTAKRRGSIVGSDLCLYWSDEVVGFGSTSWDPRNGDEIIRLFGPNRVVVGLRFLFDGREAVLHA